MWATAVGRINKLAPDYIGMLVLGAFNAVVHKDQLQGKFEFEKQVLDCPQLIRKDIYHRPSRGQSSHSQSALLQGGVWVQSSDTSCRLKAGSMVKFAIQRYAEARSYFATATSSRPQVPFHDRASSWPIDHHL